MVESQDLSVKGQRLTTTSADRVCGNPHKNKMGLNRSRSLSSHRHQCHLHPKAVQNKGGGKLQLEMFVARKKQQPQFFTTQEDIYRILDETSDVIRPTSNLGRKRLSPYNPLPAIGGTSIFHQDEPDETSGDVNNDNRRGTTIQKSPEETSRDFNNDNRKDTTIQKSPDETSRDVNNDNRKGTTIQKSPDETSKDVNNDNRKDTTIQKSHLEDSTEADSLQISKMSRERTYNVLEPKFVKGPTEVLKESPNKSSLDLLESTTTVVFGPRVQTSGGQEPIKLWDGDKLPQAMERLSLDGHDSPDNDKSIHRTFWFDY